MGSVGIYQYIRKWREKKYKLGFIASGDHNSIGIGLACIWVKEISRNGILDAMRNRRVFGTTGDQIEVDFRINGVVQGQTSNANEKPKLTYTINAVDHIESVEILRNSSVIKTIKPQNLSQEYTGEFVDEDYQTEKDILYYYVRIIQKNEHIAWSSPIWIES